jgi:cell division protein FtsQ
VRLPEEQSSSRAPKAKRRWLRPAAIAAAAFVILSSPLWAPLLLRELSFFRVRHVEVIGVRYLEPGDILERLNVDTLASVWDPSDPLRARVAAHPLVREVTVGRKLPGTLVVRLVEHAPVALVPAANGFRAFDERGVVLPIDLTKADVNAPILARADVTVLRLLGAARTRAPGLYSRMSEVRRDGTGGELVFVLDSIPVRTRADITLHRLADVELVEQDLARRKLHAVELDLRYRDQVIARFQ